MKKEKYVFPNAEEIVVRMGDSLLSGSLTTNASSGENLTEDSEYNPW